MTKNILITSLSIVVVVAAAIFLTYAFINPSNEPSSGNSSSGSLLNQMSGDSFQSSSDSLSAIRQALDNLTSN
ncbi:MAG: hypothetical protein NTZ80_00430 [Patescibacteria group bacterium]|nr:hypothetical protein [Patescibacteria group bacterium]